VDGLSSWMFVEGLKRRKFYISSAQTVTRFKNIPIGLPFGGGLISVITDVHRRCRAVAAARANSV